MVDQLPPPPVPGEPRPDSPIYGSPQLKEVVVAAAQAGEISEYIAAEIFAEYGLRDA